MTLFNDPSYLNGLGTVLLIVGGVGLVSLLFFPAGRRTAKRALAVLFAVLVVAGGALPWRAQTLRAADRDLSPAQQAALTQAIGRFPDSRFEIFTSRDDKEAH